MIRAATPDDVARLCEMGATFWAQSPWRAVGPFSPKKARCGFLNFIASDSVGLFVIDGPCGVSGAICVLAADLWTVDNGVMAQELFWWVEPSGSTEAMDLLSAAEDWAASRGAPLFAMIRLEGMRDNAVDRLYRRRGYEVREHLYTRAI